MIPKKFYGSIGSIPELTKSICCSKLLLSIFLVVSLDCPGSPQRPEAPGRGSTGPLVRSPRRVPWSPLMFQTVTSARF
jgi:hypothetical protein